MGSLPVVYLHIGEPKTGSTHLQQVMWRNRAALARTGLMLPGPRPLAHWRATQDLREVEQLPNDPIGPHAGAWDRLVRQALRAPRAAVISHELLAAVSEAQARRALDSFGEAEIHVIHAVRDFATLLPAEWQESVKHRSTRSWPDWLRDVIDQEAESADRRQWWFWRVHDSLEILRIWSAGLPPECVHVVTVPPRGSSPDVLWRRFAGIVGADHKSIDVTRASTNPSLGIAEVEYLRRLNLELPEEIPDWFYMRTVKEVIANSALTNGSKAERLELPAERHEWARQQSRWLADGLQRSGFDIVGDLDDLVPFEPLGSRSPADLDEEELLGPSLAATTTLLTAIAATQGVAAEPVESDPLGSKTPSKIKQAVIAMSLRSQTAHRLRRGYWHVANARRRIRRASRDRAA
ncbi:MAG TPA: hypothetical protein VG650_16745 [Mycobacteriales bacterium]|nr:hypothetical protein [Mycobacteriales bacterium]